MRNGARAMLALALAALLPLAPAGCDSDSDDDLTGDEIYIKPASYTFKSADDKTVTLSVYGAKPPFQWRVSDPDMGTITGVTVNTNTYTGTANYTRTPNMYGINTVFVIDARQWRASSVINVREGIDD
jgi:ABC-type glycerol-3-phosphate transport system substrate-binding protein